MKNTLLLACFLLCGTVFSQTRYVSGNITDENNEPLPYTNVIISGTSEGTSANFSGEYLLGLTPGIYKLSFQFIGYQSKVIEVDVTNSDKELDVKLNVEILNLKEVVVTANDEEPAYAIIRQAQKNRKKYLNEFNEYEHKSYTKIFAESENTGSPMSLFGTDLLSKPGIFYLSETISNIRYHGNRQNSETLIASIVSGDSASYSENKAIFINFYTNRTLRVNQKEFVSPIATDAFSFYDYKFEGYFMEGEDLINKIKLIPKNKSLPAFTGHIYIIEDSWRIFGVLAFADKQAAVVGDIELRVAYTPYPENKTWLPFSFDFFIGATSIDAYYHSLYSDFHFDLSDREKISPELRYRIADGAKNKNPDYWSKNRPIPLSEEEVTAYKTDQEKLEDEIKAASEKSIAQTEEDLNDTISKNSGKRPFAENLFFSKDKILNPKWAYKADALLSQFNFNTVEGFVVGHKSKFTRKSSNYKKLTIEPAFRYGFSSKQFYSKIRITQDLDLKKPSYISFNGGHYIEQISGFNSISELNNTLNSLFLGRNYIKLYEKTFAELTLKREVINGVDLTLSTEYADRSTLENNSDFSFRKEDKTDYTSNDPFINAFNSSFTRNTILKFKGLLNIDIKRPYNELPEGKEILASRYPNIKIATEIGKGDSHYSMFWANANHQQRTGTLGISFLSASYGKFLDNRGVYITEFFHFAGNQTIFTSNSRNFGLKYELLDYYSLSNSNSFFGLNFDHDFKGFLLKKLPLIKKTSASVKINANYLDSPIVGNYVEAGVQLTNLFQAVNVGYFQSYLNGRKTDGMFRVGANINFN